MQCIYPLIYPRRSSAGGRNPILISSIILSNGGCWKNMRTDNSSLTFTFEGDYEVSAVSLITAVQGLIRISDEIAKYNYPDVEFRLSIRALKPGSLSFDFIALALPALTLLSPSNVEYAKNLIDCIKTSFEIKKFLKGKNPIKKEKSDRYIIIENKDGQKIKIPEDNNVYFINPNIDQSISTIFETLSPPTKVSGIKVSNENSSVHVPASDFSMCAQRIDISKFQEECRKGDPITFIRHNEVLYIRKPDILGGSKWEFKSDKNITADIEDAEFLNSIHSGKQPIVSKMYIVADLRVVMMRDKDGLPDDSTCKYTVLKVHSVNMPTRDQLSLYE